MTRATWCSIHASADPGRSTRLAPACFNAVAFGTRSRSGRRDSQGGKGRFQTYRHIWRGLVCFCLVMGAVRDLPKMGLLARHTRRGHVPLRLSLGLGRGERLLALLCRRSGSNGVAWDRSRCWNWAWGREVRGLRHDLAVLRRVRHKRSLHWVLWARERVWHALREIWLVRPDGCQYSWQHSRICLCR